MEKLVKIGKLWFKVTEKPKKKVKEVEKPKKKSKKLI